MGDRVAARVEIRGSLAFIETELGERAVVPVSSLCKLIARFNLEIVEGDTIVCPEVIETGGVENDADGEDSGEAEE